MLKCLKTCDVVTDQSGQMLAMGDVKEGAGGPDRPVTGWGGGSCGAYWP